MMFFHNDDIEEEFGNLPERIRKSVERSGKEIESVDELKELVRRIRNAESGKLN